MAVEGLGAVIRPRPLSLWISHPALSLRPPPTSSRQPYRRRRRCNNWLTPFLAVRCARGSRASLSAPRRTISPRLPLSFFFLATTRPPLLGCAFETKERSLTVTVRPSMPQGEEVE